MNNFTKDDCPIYTKHHGIEQRFYILYFIIISNSFFKILFVENKKHAKNTPKGGSSHKRELRRGTTSH